MKRTIILALLLPFFTQSQKPKEYVVSDLESWSAISAEYEVIDNLTLKLETQMRLEVNSTQLQQYFGEFGIEYKFNKNWQAEVAYRFAAKPDEDITEHFRRLQADLGYRHEIERLTLCARLRYQYYNRFGERTEEDIPEHGLRLKLSGEYNIPDWKLDPELTTEIFRYTQDQNSEFGKIRFTLGTSYKVKKWFKLDPFYGIERELTGTYPKTTYLVGLKLKFKL